MNKKKMELYQALFEHLGMYDYTEEEYQNDEDYGYITENTAVDGNTYYWYVDEINSALINVDTGEIIDDDETIEKLFFL